MERATPSPIVDRGTIRSRFRDCGTGYIGQVLDAPDQPNYEICKSPGRDIVGSCDEVWQTGWSSQCDCTNTPISAR